VARARPGPLRKSAGMKLRCEVDGVPQSRKRARDEETSNAGPPRGARFPDYCISGIGVGGEEVRVVDETAEVGFRSGTRSARMQGEGRALRATMPPIQLQVDGQEWMGASGGATGQVWTINGRRGSLGPPARLSSVRSGSARDEREGGADRSCGAEGSGGEEEELLGEAEQVIRDPNNNLFNFCQRKETRGPRVQTRSRGPGWRVIAKWKRWTMFVTRGFHV